MSKLIKFQNSTFDKALYWERRNHKVIEGKGKAKIEYIKPLRGQTGYANVTQAVEDVEGITERIPIGFKRGPGFSSRKNKAGREKAVDRRYTKPNHGKFVRDKQKKI